MTKKEQTYDFICFSDLAYEFENTNRKDIEARIRRRLKYYGKGNYNQARIDYLRTLRNGLFSEISLREKSKYYVQRKTQYCDPGDFNLEQMQRDYNKIYDRISTADMNRILSFAVYIFYLR